MTEKELKRQYDKLASDIEGMRIYDGRNAGVDVYVCEKCGKQLCTRYKDKGVTPFTVGCRSKECRGTMIHKNTISEFDAVYARLTVHNWVRPTFEWLDKQRKKGNEGLIEHVLNGGLVLESELE